MSWVTTSIWLKVAVVCILLATVLFVLGFATNDWMTSTYGLLTWGLWKVKGCDRQRCVTQKITTLELEHRDMEVWFRAVQLFECIGLICLAVSLIVILITVFLTSVRKRIPLLVIIICSFAGAAAIIIGAVIFATQLDYYDVAWSMGVAIAGAVCLFVAAIMGVIDLNR